MSRYFKFKRAFTLVESLVVIGIVFVLLTIIVSRQGNSAERIALTNLADEISSTLSEAQAYGTGVKEFSPGTGSFPKAYGLSFYVLPSGVNNAYISFGDRNNDQVYGGDLTCATGGATDECLKKVDMTAGNIIDSICAIRSSGGDMCNLGRVDVSFARPATEAQITLFNSSGNPISPANVIGARIVLKSPSNLTQTVNVYNTGQISVLTSGYNYPAMTVTLTASPTNPIPYNSAATLTWMVTNATHCNASGAWNGNRSVNGGTYDTGNLTSNQTYNISCDGQSGTVNDSVTVSVSAPAVPTVTTNAATVINNTSATLNGAANPNGLTTTGWFRYSTTNPGTCNDTFGTRAPSSSGSNVGNGASAVAYNTSVSGLSSATTYYYCAIASNTGGTGVGNVLSFQTTLPSNWNSWDIATQAGSPQGTVLSSVGTANIEFYESTNNGGVTKGSLFSTFNSGAHPETFNNVTQYWGAGSGITYPYAGKSTVGRGSDVSEGNAQSPSGVNDLQLHPPNNLHSTVAAFKVPVDGTYTISNLGVRRVSSSGGNVRFRVFNSSGTELSNLLATPNQDWVTSASTYTLSSLTTGSYVYFTSQNEDGYSYDATEVSWTLSYTSCVVTGGTITTSGSYRVHTFTSGGTFSTNCPLNVDYLVVGGGGGGGRSEDPTNKRGGGGGAGGMRTGSSPVSAGAYTITVGAGGPGNTGADHGNVGSGSSFGAISSTLGGGYGGGGKSVGTGAGSSGGSGGGSSFSQGNTSGTSGEGNGSSDTNPNGNGGGGAGGGNAGLTGGPGLASSITGSSVIYAAGGNSGGNAAGATNTGNGGQGASENTGQNGGAGGSGIVIIRYIP